MFKKELRASLIRIFGIANTTFEEPDVEAPEQDVLFVEITDAKTRPYGPDRISAKVTGNLILFSQAARTPYGFFNKKIQQAKNEDRKKFIFGREIDVPDSPARIQDLHEKQVPFTFLYDAQYDPDQGEISSLDAQLSWRTR